jgi:Ca2+-binding RTX toxin-like protein
MAFSSRITINGKTLHLTGDTDGSRLSLSLRIVNGETTTSLSSNDDLRVTATGNLNATINGGDEDDLFDFSRATGQYRFFTGAGADTVFDGSGDNLFDGGAGPDTFVFNSVPDTVPNELDTIQNFQDEIDVIRIENTGNAATFADTEAGALITLADGDQILVENRLVLDIRDSVAFA